MLSTGPTRSNLVAQFLQNQQRQFSQTPNPQTGWEAAARVGSGLVDALVSKQAIDDELRRRQEANAANIRAMQTAVGGVPAWQDPDNPENTLVQAIAGGTPEAYSAAMGVEGVSPEVVQMLMGQQLQQQTAQAQNRTFAPQPMVRQRTLDDGTVEEYVALVVPQFVNGETVLQEIGESPNLTPEQAAELQLTTARLQGGQETAEARRARRQQAQDELEQGFIDTAFSAIGEIRDVRESLDLLDKVSTGGFDSMKASVTDFFGTTPGDIGEFRFLMAQNVLAALSNFTGAISEGERQFLTDTMADMTQGKEVNRRILERLSRTAERALERGRSVLNSRAENGDESAIEMLRLFDEEMGAELTLPSSDIQLTEQEDMELDMLDVSQGRMTQEEFNQKWNR